MGGDALPSGGESELGALLRDGYDAAAGGDESPAGEGGTGTPESPSETPAETPLGESQQDAPLEAGEVQPALDATAPQLPQGWSLSEDGKSLVVPRAQLPQVQSAMQYAGQVGQYFANPQEAQVAYQTAADMRMMSNDWQYGSDQSIQGVLQHWAGFNHQDPMARQAFQGSFTKMLSMAPDMLKNFSPQGYQQFVSAQGDRLVASLYERAAMTQNPEDLMNAQSVEWGLKGKYQTEIQKTDPAEQQRQAFEAQRRDFDQRQSVQLRRDETNFRQSSLDGANISKLNELIGQQLTSIKDRYPELAFNDMVRGINADVMKELAGNTEWWTEHSQALDQLVKDYRHLWQTNGDPAKTLGPRIAAFNQDFLTRAQRLLPSIAQKRVNANTAARIASTTQRTRPNGTAPQSPARQPATNGDPKNARPRFDDEWAKFTGTLGR